MLTKYLSRLALVVIASASLLSSIDETSGNTETSGNNEISMNNEVSGNNEISMTHQKDIQMDGPISHGDPHATRSSVRHFDLAKRDTKFFSIPIIERGGNYLTELYMGSRGDRIEVLVNLRSPDTLILDTKTSCNGYSKREVQEKRDIPEHDPKGSQSSVVLEKKHISEAGKIEGEAGKTESKAGKTEGEAGKTKRESEEEEQMPIHSNIVSKRKLVDCDARSSFRQSKSKTFKLYEDNPFYSFKYPDDSSASGVWGFDKVGTSKTMIKMVFALAEKSTRTTGCLGLGTLDGTSMNLESTKHYVNFPKGLKNAGYIKKMTYSLFLNGSQSEGNSILFGAVDHKKYVGKLQTVPMVSEYKLSNQIDLAIALHEIYLENSKLNQKVVILNEPIAVPLSLKAEYRTLPKNTFLALVESMSGVLWSVYKLYRVDCAYSASSNNIVYNFSGIKIKVPLRDLISRYQDVCYLKVKETDDARNRFSSANLGLSFFQHVYMNVDLESKEVSIAQLKVTNEEKIEEITTSVPSAVKAERYSSTSLVYKVSRPTVAKFKV